MVLCLLSLMLRLQTHVSLTGFLHRFWKRTWILMLECQALYRLSRLPSSGNKSVLNMEFENFGMGKLICLPSMGHLLYLVWSHPSCKTGLMCLFSWVPAFLCPSLSRSWAWRAAYSQRQGMAFISRILEPVVYSCPHPGAGDLAWFISHHLHRAYWWLSPGVLYRLLSWTKLCQHLLF